MRHLLRRESSCSVGCASGEIAYAKQTLVRPGRRATRSGSLRADGTHDPDAVALIDEEDVNVGSLPGFGYGPMPDRSRPAVRAVPPAAQRSARRQWPSYVAARRCGAGEAAREARETSAAARRTERPRSPGTSRAGRTAGFSPSAAPLQSVLGPLPERDAVGLLADERDRCGPELAGDPSRRPRRPRNPRAGGRPSRASSAGPRWSARTRSRAAGTAPADRACEA